MNKTLLITTLLALGATTASAQRLMVTQATIDCGRTGFQQPVTATFELRNKGLRKLRISDVHPDCGCTQVDYPKKEIGANEKFTIRLTYDAQQLGHFYKQAAVVSNGSRTPVYLTMKGVVLEEVQDFSGLYPYDFGGLLLDKDNLEFDDVNKGDRPMQEIHILNNTGKTVNPSVMHLPPYLEAEITPQQLAPGRSATIRLTLKSANIRDFGLTQTAVYLAKNPGDKVQSENEIGISAVLLPDLKNFGGTNRQYAPKMVLSAQSMELGAFEKKSKKSGELTITNNGRTELNISSLQMFTPGLRVTLGKRKLQPGETTKLKITAMRNELRKVRTKPRVLMITNDPEHAKVVININVK